jgi:hypothetical protein
MREREVLRAFGKPVWTWPSVVAVDAGPMQIQLAEGTVLRCPEAAPRSTTHYGPRKLATAQP